MLMIRFQRIGRTNDPAFRIAVLEKARAAKSGNIVEQLGTYNPKTKALTLDEEKVKMWISKGAQPTDSMHNLLVSKGVIEGKKRNVLPKKTPVKKEEPEVQATPETPAAPTSDVGEEGEAQATPETPVEETSTEAGVVAEAVPGEVAPSEEAPVVDAPPVASTESAVEEEKAA